MNATALIDLLSEVLMLVLGLLLVLLALGGWHSAPSGARLWLVLGAVLVIWGGRTWMRKNRYAKPRAQLMQWVRGSSLVLAGALMIAMVWMPQHRAQVVLVAVGCILALRGLAGTSLAARGLVR